MGVQDAKSAFQKGKKLKGTPTGKNSQDWRIRHPGFIKCRILITILNVRTKLLSCPKLADIAILQASAAAANYKQI